MLLRILDGFCHNSDAIFQWIGFLHYLQEGVHGIYMDTTQVSFRDMLLDHFHLLSSLVIYDPTTWYRNIKTFSQNGDQV